MLRGNNCQPKIQHLDKLPFTIEGKIKVLFKEKLGFIIIFTTHKSLLKELLKDVHQEGNWFQREAMVCGNQKWKKRRILLGWGRGLGEEEGKAEVNWVEMGLWERTGSQGSLRCEGAWWTSGQTEIRAMEEPWEWANKLGKTSENFCKRDVRFPSQRFWKNWVAFWNWMFLSAGLDLMIFNVPPSSDILQCWITRRRCEARALEFSWIQCMETSETLKDELIPFLKTRQQLILGI